VHQSTFGEGPAHVSVRDARSGSELWSSVTAPSGISAVDLLGGQLALGREDGRIDVVDLDSGKLQKLKKRAGRVTDLRWASSGALAAGDGDAHFVKGASVVSTKLDRRSDEPTHLALLPAGGVLAGCGSALARYRDGEWAALGKRDRETVMAVGHDPDGLSVSVHADGEIVVWDPTPRTAKLGDNVAAAALLPDGRVIWVGEDDDAMRVATLDGKQTRALARHGAAVFALGVDGAGGRAWSAGRDEILRVWDVASGACLCTCAPGPALSVALRDRWLVIARGPHAEIVDVTDGSTACTVLVTAKADAGAILTPRGVHLVGKPKAIRDHLVMREGLRLEPFDDGAVVTGPILGA
jgi:WD40 repeat protein